MMWILIAIFFGAIALILAASTQKPQPHKILGDSWEAIPVDDPSCDNCHCAAFGKCRLSLKWDAMQSTGEDCCIDEVIFRRVG